MFTFYLSIYTPVFHIYICFFNDFSPLFSYKIVSKSLSSFIFYRIANSVCILSSIVGLVLGLVKLKSKN